MAWAVLMSNFDLAFFSQIPGFGDTYLMVRPDHPRTQKRAYPNLTERLVQDDRVSVMTE